MSDDWMPEYDEAAALRLLDAVMGNPEIGMPSLLDDPVAKMLGIIQVDH